MQKKGRDLWLPFIVDTIKKTGGLYSYFMIGYNQIFTVVIIDKNIKRFFIYLINCAYKYNIIIMILYYIQKYCIQSEVEQILITKNIIEKFTVSNTNLLFSNVVNKLQLTKRLDDSFTVSGNL